MSSLRIRVWVLRATFVWLLVTMILTVVPKAQRQDSVVVSASVRYAIQEAAKVNADAISSLRTEVAVLKNTAEDTKEELTEARRAMWTMAGTLLISLLTQIHAARKARST